ncbi:MAG: outer membrane beta-barrel protein [Ectothiorhodospiraceae bacterium]|nr:outer membrane beta-barrel protein [Ectothiorhodospiraceae bacterium]
MSQTIGQAISQTMSRTKGVVLVGLLSLVAVSPVSADWFFGVKTGPMLIDANGISDTTNTGVVVGYDIGLVVADVAVEGEFTTTTSDGKFIGNKVEVDTQALYMAFRTGGPFYFKAKAGLVNEEITIGGISETDSGVSYGVGLGFGIGIAQLELELTTIEQDIAFLSVGVQF